MIKEIRGMIQIDSQPKSYNDINTAPAGLTHQMSLIYIHIVMVHKFVHIKERKYKRSPISAVF